MADPAVEAARRALTNIGYGRSGHVQRVTAAREALKPIRGLFEGLPAVLQAGQSDDRSTELIFLDFLEKLAPLIYSSEELRE